MGNVKHESSQEHILVSKAHFAITHTKRHTHARAQAHIDIDVCAPLYTWDGCLERGLPLSPPDSTVPAPTGLLPAEGFAGAMEDGFRMEGLACANATHM
jgi:hypothetical protein